MNNLDVYEKLREFHDDVKEIGRQDMTSWKLNAIEALHSVLYLAEEVFASDEKLTSDNSVYPATQDKPASPKYAKRTSDKRKR